TSLVAVDTAAVLDRVDPDGVLGFTLTTNVKVAVAPAANVAFVPLKVPVPPTDGFDRLKFGPAVCVADTNVVLRGTASLSDTCCALLGPNLLTMIVYVRF